MTESTYTIPALRDAAEKLRADATAFVNDAEIRAAQLREDARKLVEEANRTAGQMRAAADEIDADAEARRQAAERPCQACGLPMVNGPLGWQHKDPYAPCHLGQVVTPTIQGRAEPPAAERPMGSLEMCPGCRQPIVWDGLGWTHAGRTDCTADLSAFDPQQDGAER